MITQPWGVLKWAVCKALNEVITVIYWTYRGSRGAWGCSDGGPLCIQWWETLSTQICALKCVMYVNECVCAAASRRFRVPLDPRWGFAWPRYWEGSHSTSHTNTFVIIMILLSWTSHFSSVVFSPKSFCIFIFTFSQRHYSFAHRDCSLMSTIYYFKKIII